MVVTAA
jgi:hypothetical protein